MLVGRRRRVNQVILIVLAIFAVVLLYAVILLGCYPIVWLFLSLYNHNQQLDLAS